MNCHVDTEKVNCRIEKLNVSIDNCLSTIESIFNDIDSINKVLNQLRSYNGSRASNYQEIIKDGIDFGKIVIGYKYFVWDINIDNSDVISDSLNNLDLVNEDLNSLKDLSLNASYSSNEILYFKNKILSVLSDNVVGKSIFFNNRNENADLFYKERETHTSTINPFVISKNKFYDKYTVIGTITDDKIKRVIEVENIDLKSNGKVTAGQAITYYPKLNGYFVSIAKNSSQNKVGKKLSVLQFVSRDGKVIKRRVLDNSVIGHAGGLQYNKKTDSIDILNGGGSHTKTSINVRDFFDSNISNSDLKYTQVRDENDYRAAIAYDSTTGNFITTNNFNGDKSDTFILKKPDGTVYKIPKMKASNQDICAHDGVIFAVEDNNINFYNEETGDYLGTQEWPDYIVPYSDDKRTDNYLPETFNKYTSEHGLENYAIRDETKPRKPELESITHVSGNRYAVLVGTPATPSPDKTTSTFSEIIYEVEFSIVDN